MKTRSILFLIFLSFTAWGQSGQKPKYVLNGEEFDSQSVEFISTDNIEKIDVVKDINQPEVRITTKKKIEFLDYAAIKKQAKFNQEDNPGIIIDLKKIENRETLLVDKEIIKDIIAKNGAIEIRTTRKME